MARIVTFGNTTLNATTGEAFAERSAKMRPSAARLLAHLAHTPGRACSRAALHHALYGHRADGGPVSNVIAVSLWEVRRALREAGSDSEIARHPRVGWALRPGAGQATVRIAYTPEQYEALRRLLIEAARWAPELARELAFIDPSGPDPTAAPAAPHNLRIKSMASISTYGRG